MKPRNSEPKYELLEWERRVRDELLAGLGVLKFILDEDTTTYACRNLNVIRFASWSACIERFMKTNWYALTRKEKEKIKAQVDKLNERLIEYSKAVQEIERAMQP